MERFYAVLKGGEGCDFSIGCGTKVVRLTAEDWELAEEQAHKLYEDHGGKEMVFSVEVLRVAELRTMDMAAWEREREEARQAKEQAKDRAELERLARKLNVEVVTR